MALHFARPKVVQQQQLHLKGKIYQSPEPGRNCWKIKEFLTLKEDSVVQHLRAHLPVFSIPVSAFRGNNKNIRAFLCA